MALLTKGTGLEKSEGPTDKTKEAESDSRVKGLGLGYEKEAKASGHSLKTIGQIN